ncbi:signal transducing histidine kinase, homodimeric domain protein [Candidatus Magnetoovum chiemensis]|nr:signal transducing histidine kinase, homodimeric domain protein [Candidatus Magnetoovum chiemensis]
MADEMEEIVSDFLIETTEIIQDLDQKFIELEGDRQNQDLVNDIFRSVHTVKGASGFLGFNQMVSLTHAAENVLKRIKENTLELNPVIMDAIFETIDMMKILLEHIKSKDGAEEDLTGLIAKLKNIYESSTAAAQASAQEEPKEAAAAVMDDDAALAALMEMDSGTSMVGSTPIPEGKQVKPLGEILIEEGKITKEDVEESLQIQGIIKESIETGEVPKIGQILESRDKISNEDIKKAASKQAPATEREKPQQVEQTIRVDVERLDNVLNLVGELVLNRNRLMRIGSQLEIKFPDNHDITNLVDANASINVITTDLQLAVMKTRMQPIKKVFNRFPRMVRDLARNMQKDVELKLVGEDTELDKSIIEEIGDPLVHLIRNSVDHGVEEPAERENRGKPRRGTVILSASQEGNNIVLAIEDDGKGIDVDRLKEKVLEKELASPEELERMSEKELLDFIFMPGFSTAKQVTDVSGRGVGMDVVKTNISRLNGTIHIETEPNVGTKFFIKLPLTLAIIQALVVGVGEEVYAIPLSSVVETVRLNKGELKTVRGQETVLLRHEVVPIHRLARKFFINAPSATSSDKMYMVVIVVGEKKFGIMVDKLFGQEEIVIKSIEGYSNSAEGIAGATITGDGKVVLILDPAQMF